MGRRTKEEPSTKEDPRARNRSAEQVNTPPARGRGREKVGQRTKEEPDHRATPTHRKCDDGRSRSQHRAAPAGPKNGPPSSYNSPPATGRGERKWPSRGRSSRTTEEHRRAEGGPRDEVGAEDRAAPAGPKNGPAEQLQRPRARGRGRGKVAQRTKEQPNDRAAPSGRKWAEGRRRSRARGSTHQQKAVRNGHGHQVRAQGQTESPGRLHALPATGRGQKGGRQDGRKWEPGYGHRRRTEEPTLRGNGESEHPRGEGHGQQAAHRRKAAASREGRETGTQPAEKRKEAVAEQRRVRGEDGAKESKSAPERRQAATQGRSRKRPRPTGKQKPAYGTSEAKNVQRNVEPRSRREATRGSKSGRHGRMGRNSKGRRGHEKREGQRREDGCRRRAADQKMGVAAEAGKGEG